MEQPKWLNNPRYQRAVQKMTRMGPNRNAILDTVIADEAFADAEMRNRLQMMRLAAQKTGNERGLKLGEGRLALDEKRLGYDKTRSDARYNLAKGTMDMRQDDDALAKKLGWGNIAVSGVQGLASLKKQKQQTDWLRQLASQYPKQK